MADPAPQRSPRSEHGKAFATLLRSARERAKLRQAEVAEKAGLPLRTIIRWEGGNIDSPKPADVRAVCQVLDVDPRQAAAALGYIDEPEGATSSAAGEDDAGYELTREAARASRALGAIIRVGRKEKGWASEELASRSGIPVDRLILIEAGFGGYCPPDEIRPLYQALGIPLIQLAAVGYSNAVAARSAHYAAEDFLAILQSPEIPEDLKYAVVDYLRHQRDGSSTPRRQTASQRFCAAIGKPHPGPLNAKEKAEWRRRQDEADADAARYVGRDPRRHVA
ncbi:helix-turn-helix domain-containing protein [Plantactinospora sp. WMMB334]|uniref:helix-turn-helix domain-containing protein n=1 Tax=Plantactinospora sp. WMMB334 TaxID=3404119 RepID=UPI003B95546D